MLYEDRQDRERWLASGLPDAVITIMFRDGTLPPPSAARWYDSGLTTEEIAEYRRTGRQAPDAFGLPSDPAFLANWDGMSPPQILAAIDRGFISAAQFRPWEDTDADAVEVERLAGIAHLEGFKPGAAVRAVREGRTPEEIGFGLVAGIPLKKVGPWIEGGLDARAAGAWSAAGFSARKTVAWRAVTDDPDLARRLKALGFDADSAAAARPDEGWSPWTIRRHLAMRAGCADWDVDRWAQASLPAEQLEHWIRAGVDPEAAEGWYARDVDPAEAAVWAAEDFTPDGAAEWRAAGISPAIAARRRAAGVHPPAAS